MQIAEYISALEQLALAGRPGPLKRAIENRLLGEGTAVDVVLGGTKMAITSPALEREEHSPNDVLYSVFQTLRKRGEAAGLENLRRAAAELLDSGLSDGAGTDYLMAVARLVGYFQVGASGELGPMLQRMLLGYLSSELPRTLENLIGLDGHDLERATLALDTWLAITPIMPRAQQHHRSHVEGLFWRSIETFQILDCSRPRQRFLFLAFRLLIKMVPGMAGDKGLEEMCKVVDRFSKGETEFVRRWRGLCSHQGVVFAAHPAWREAFKQGVATNLARKPFSGPPSKLLRQALEDLNGLWQEVDHLAGRKPHFERRELVA